MILLWGTQPLGSVCCEYHMGPYIMILAVSDSQAPSSYSLSQPQLVKRTYHHIMPLIINMVNPIISLPFGMVNSTHKNGDDLGMLYDCVLAN